MTTRYADAPGLPVLLAELKYQRSLSLGSFLSSRVNPRAELVELRKTPEGDEVIVFEVEVEVSRVRAFDIHPREQLAVVFRERDELSPEVLALREDFPHVPHLNPRDEEIPRSLCLYEESFDELKLTWTPASFVERARWWLSETAKGRLNGQDQPLEPILLGDFPPLVLPSNFLECMSGTDAAQPLSIELRSSRGREVYVVGPGKAATGFAAMCIVCPPHVHGAIRSHPRNMGRLNEMLKSIGFDLAGKLRDRLAGWEFPTALLRANPILVIVLPKQRRPGGDVETHEF